LHQQQQLEALHARTGVETLLFAVRGSSNRYNRAEVFYTSEKIPEFFQLSLGNTVQDVAL
jgi:hypothetical protein